MTEKQEMVLELLKKRGSQGATTKEIEDVCVVAAARDWVRRLRDAGHSIQTIEEPRTKSGCRCVRYKLVEQQGVQRDLWGEGNGVEKGEAPGDVRQVPRAG